MAQQGTAGVDNKSQNDPYPVTVTVAATTRPTSATTIRRRRSGDFVWDDLNGNGIQDVGEPGLDGRAGDAWS